MSSNGITSPRKRRFYVQGSVMPFGEDSKHEFKGHRNLAVEELPRWCFVPGVERRSHRAVSRVLNAFLNTGLGGTVYLGVLDDGTTKGLRLSAYQMDHVRVSLTDLMNRYNPPAHKSRYKIEFVPVVDKELGSNESACNSSCTDTEEEQMHYKGHLLRTYSYCWCDKHAVTLYNRIQKKCCILCGLPHCIVCRDSLVALGDNKTLICASFHGKHLFPRVNVLHQQIVLGIVTPEYVVEITIGPFIQDPATVNGSTLQLHPVYEDEEERCYFRRTASVQAYTHKEVMELTVHQVRVHFEKVTKSFRNEEQHLLNLATR